MLTPEIQQRAEGNEATAKAFENAKEYLAACTSWRIVAYTWLAGGPDLRAWASALRAFRNAYNAAIKGRTAAIDRFQEIPYYKSKDPERRVVRQEIAALDRALRVLDKEIVQERDKALAYAQSLLPSTPPSTPAISEETPRE